MNYINLDDVIGQLRGAGLVIESAKNAHGGAMAGPLYVESTKSVRCDTVEKPGKRSGAYRLHELRLKDGIWLAGSYWLDHGNTNFKIDLNKECADCGQSIPLKSTTCPACGSGKRHKAREIPPEEVERHRRIMAENKRQAEAAEKARHERAAIWASAVWRAARPATLDDHDYFARKGLSGTAGARLLESVDGLMLDGGTDDDQRKLAQYVGSLVLPLQDTEGRTWGLQFILSRARHADLIKRMETDKVFWPSGMKMDGMLYQIGGSIRDVGLVCEGYATGITLDEATNLPVTLAWNAGNVPKVTAALRKRNKRARLLVCADDDWLQQCRECKQYTPVETDTCTHCGQPHGKGNAGVRHAREAATAADVAWVAPQFSARPDNRKGPTDFNDLAALDGLGAVQGQIEARLAALEWDAAPPLAQGVSTGGRGDLAQGHGPDIGFITLDVMLEHFRLILTTEDYFDHRMNRVWSHSALLKATPRGVVNDWAGRRDRMFCLPEQVGFDPNGIQDGIVCNLYDGWPTVPRAGKCDAIKALLRRLCSFEADKAGDLFDWVWKWHAFQVQNPGAKMITSIIVHGDHGAGKNLVFSRGFKPIFGKYGIEFGQNALEEKYNEWMSAKLYGIGNEVIASHESLYHMKGYIKNIITESFFQIRAMHQSARQERNCLNMVFLSNELQPLNLEKTDRRFCVIWTPDTPQAGDTGFAEFRQLIAEVLEELENGGSAALHHELLATDLGDFHEGTPPPRTKAKDDLIELSLDSKERFIDDWLEERIGSVPATPVPVEMLYDLYRIWCAKGYAKSPAPLPKLSAAVAKRRGSKKHVGRYLDGQKEERCTFIYPNFIHEPPNGQAKTTWLTECVEDFKQAVDAYKGDKYA